MPEKKRREKKEGPGNGRNDDKLLFSQLRKLLPARLTEEVSRRELAWVDVKTNTEDDGMRKLSGLRDPVDSVSSNSNNLTFPRYLGKNVLDAYSIKFWYDRYRPTFLNFSPIW